MFGLLWVDSVQKKAEVVDRVFEMPISLQEVLLSPQHNTINIDNTFILTFLCFKKKEY